VHHSLVCAWHAAAPAPRRPPHSGPILWRSSLKNTIFDVLRARKGWQESEPDGDWDFFWADKGCGRAAGGREPEHGGEQP
jgi:hypothetical protein